MRFRIDLKIFLFIVLFCITRQIEIYATIMFFAILHELGHLIAGVLLGMKPEKIEIMPYGLSISFRLSLEDYNKKIKRGNQFEVKKIFIALAGPITNFIMIIIALQWNKNIFDTLIILYSNILLILFNLLPIYPLDGGRVLKGVLYLIFGKRKSETYINRISFIVLLIVTCIASLIIYQVQNIAIFLIILVLWGIFIKEDRIYEKRNKIYCLLEKIKT